MREGGGSGGKQYPQMIGLRSQISKMSGINVSSGLKNNNLSFGG